MASGTIKTQTRIRRRRVDAKIPANSTSGSVTAVLDTNETFLLWVSCISIQWVGYVYPSDPNLKTSYIWTDTSPTSTDRTVHCYYLVEVTS